MRDIIVPIDSNNQGFFSATNPNNPALLTVNPSALFFNQIAAARIENNSVLSVQYGRSLLLVGGDIKMDAGRLNAYGGRVELGGLASEGTVGLNGDGNNLSLSFPNSVERSDVSLSNRAQVRVIADDGGSIALNARNLEMTGNSLLFAGIGRGLGSDSSKAGNISVNATGTINLNNSGIVNEVQSGTNGQGGDVSINASSLRLEGGAQISTGTFGAGKGGNLRVDAQDVQVIGRSANGQAVSALGASAEPNSTGNAGDLTIKTNTLLVRDGAQVGAATFGAGKGGNLRVDAQDVQVIGRSANGQAVSALGASAERNSTGNAGDLTIKTNTLLVRDGAQVGANTFGAGKGGNLSVDAQDVQLIGTDGLVSSVLSATAASNSTGNGGDLTIKTNTLLVRDGAQVGAGTFGAGKGGNLSVDAQDVQLIGRTPDGLFPSGLFASAERNSTGNAGDLTIKTNTLLVRDGAQVSAGTFGQGKDGTSQAGNLKINARFINLDNGSITATTNSGNGGDITLTLKDLLLLRNNSTISTSAGTAQAGGNGGNIRINIPNGFIVAFPGQNNDITANAFNGSGGQVQIKAAGIYEIKPLSRLDLQKMGALDLDPRNLPTNDITAVSQEGEPQLDGQIFINNPDVDPSNGLVSLPVDVFDPSNQIAQGCSAFDQANASDFQVTGRGGLPPSPDETLSSDAVWEDTRLGATTPQRLDSKTTATKPKSESDTVEIIPATGWVFNGKGEVTLVSQTPNATVENVAGSSQSCRFR